MFEDCKNFLKTLPDVSRHRLIPKFPVPCRLCDTALAMTFQPDLLPGNRNAFWSLINKRTTLPTPCYWKSQHHNVKTPGFQPPSCSLIPSFQLTGSTFPLPITHHSLWKRLTITQHTLMNTDSAASKSSTKLPNHNHSSSKNNKNNNI